VFLENSKKSVLLFPDNNLKQ